MNTSRLLSPFGSLLDDLLSFRLDLLVVDLPCSLALLPLAGFRGLDADG
jgi:hypothetical protein